MPIIKQAPGLRHVRRRPRCDGRSYLFVFIATKQIETSITARLLFQHIPDTLSYARFVGHDEITITITITRRLGKAHPKPGAKRV